EVARARVLSQYKTLADAGYDVHSPTFQPLYAEGTRCVRTGDDNLRRYRQEFDELPAAKEAAEKLLGQIRTEGRDVVEGVPLNRLTALPSGALRLGADGALVYPTRTGWRHVARLLTEGQG